MNEPGPGHAPWHWWLILAAIIIAVVVISLSSDEVNLVAQSVLVAGLVIGGLVKFGLYLRRRQ